jgi:hypothetical protein
MDTITFSDSAFFSGFFRARRLKIFDRWFYASRSIGFARAFRDGRKKIVQLFKISVRRVGHCFAEDRSIC